MTRGSEPGTSISRVQISGTRSKPRRRAASAGNSALRSSVVVKMQLTNWSIASSLRSISAAISSSVAERMAAALFSGTLVAPRSAYSLSLTVPAYLRAASRSAATSASLSTRAAPGSSRAELERAEAHARQLAHAMADRLAHAPHLALSPLAELELDHVPGQQAHARGRGSPVVELDAVAERRERGSVRPPAGDARQIGLRHLVARVREQVRQLAVVGQQDQPGAVGVQAADRIQAPLVADQVDDGRAAVRVADG